MADASVCLCPLLLGQFIYDSEMNIKNHVKTRCLHWNPPDGSRNLQSPYHLSTCSITEGAQEKENQKTPISISSGLLHHPFGMCPTSPWQGWSWNQNIMDKTDLGSDLLP